MGTGDRDAEAFAQLEDEILRVDPGRREEMRLPGGHVTFGTGRSAVKVTQPKMAQWIIEHSDVLTESQER